MPEQAVAALARGSPVDAAEAFSADAFRGLEVTFKDAKVQEVADAEATAGALRREQVKALIDHHIDDEKWRELLHQAQVVAENGEKEYLLLRFPSTLCTDGSRAINNPPNGDWPKTLRGEAAELYARWRDELSPRGFRSSGARA